MEDGSLLPVLGIFGGCILPIVAGAVIAYVVLKGRHEEKMAMIDKGIVLEEAAQPERKPNRYNTLRNGILMVGLSLGVFVGILLDSSLTYDSDWTFLVVTASTVFLGGLSFVVYFFLSRYLMEKEKKEDDEKMRLEE